ncbi:hypothetical protein NDU88_002412 [Pleurodeles waltl]|uniref:Uncharacterized protein n=1 Tax=Pleurodeles waltl TaxID=8319 RepID=A0AAV7RDP6_PLEWA|nr:hypothetical protein NDU88_002412 [Pleurodeles waltl]
MAGEHGAVVSLFHLQLTPLNLRPPSSSDRVGVAPRPSAAPPGLHSVLLTSQSLCSSTPAPAGGTGQEPGRFSFGPGIGESRTQGAFSVSRPGPCSLKRPLQHPASPGLWPNSYGVPGLSCSSASCMARSCPQPPGPVGKRSTGAPSHSTATSGGPTPHLHAALKAPVHGLIGRGSSVGPSCIFAAFSGLVPHLWTLLCAQ